MRYSLRGRGGPIAAAAVFALILGLLIQLRYGYQSGTNDHLVLSLQGLQWARKGFAVGDWFIASAPQPHVLFDVVTWAGAVTGHLSGIYFAWWVTGLVVGGAATAVLATAWTPGHPVAASAAVAVLIGLGPELVLGSTTPALPTALPHELGGFLAYLTSALLLTRRPRAAAVALVATSAVHVQLGALVVVVAVAAIAVVRITEKVWWWPVGIGAAAATGIVYTILRLRPVASDGKDFIEICHEVIPYHCDATTWSVPTLWSGYAVVGAALLCLVYAVREGRTSIGLYAVTVVVPTVGLVSGVLANRYGVPVAGRMAQSTNIFRLAALLLPFGAWGLVAGFARLTARWRAAWLVGAAAAGYGWLVVREGVVPLPGAWHLGVTVLALAGAGALLRGVPGGLPAAVRGRVPAWSGTALATVGGLGAVAVLGYGAVRMGTLTDRPLDITFVPSPVHRAMGAVVERHVPVGQEVLVPPTLGVIRLVSGRSIVVDCKAVPYGGAAWREYRERLDAIGGRGSCHSGGRPFVQVPPESLTAAALRYGARYLVLGGRDPRVRTIREDLGWRVLAGPDDGAPGIWLLAAPGAPDAAA